MVSLVLGLGIGEGNEMTSDFCEVAKYPGGHYYIRTVSKPRVAIDACHLREPMDKLAKRLNAAARRWHRDILKD